MQTVNEPNVTGATPRGGCFVKTGCGKYKG